MTFSRGNYAMFVEFTDESGQKVAINIDNIEYIRRTAEDATTIELIGGTMIVVREKFETIMDMPPFYSAE
jgi:uncharacterized protein YlzI (FlbEa/FlbD family)